MTRCCIGAYVEGKSEQVGLVQFVGRWLWEDSELLLRHLAFGTDPIWGTC